jgi:glycine/D-amino acid oxidase-like deaminating enzyme
VGLAMAAAKRGAFVHERSEVLSVKPVRDGVELKTGGGTVQAGTVVVATGTPGTLFKPLARHFAVRARYGVVTRPIDRARRKAMGRVGDVLARREARALELRSAGDGRLMATGADGDAALRAGATAVAGRRPLVPAAAVVQRAGQLMYETSLLFPALSGVAADCAWAARATASRDGLFHAGPHRNYPHHLFAFGSGDGGLASGFLSAAILLRHYFGRPVPSDQLFGFGR